MAPASPLVSVIMAVHDGARYLRPAVRSVLRQTLRDLELIVVDDGSTDATGAILDAVDDPRLVRMRNDERSGLATSLNRALDVARGRYVARLDADDVALPRRLERQVACLQRSPHLAIVGSAVLELDELDRPGRLHRMPATPTEVRWALLFSSPFYHPSVVLDRAVLERCDLRYDEGLRESEDYELWVRLLEHGDGANVDEALVLYRVHPAQASRARRDIQRDIQRAVALSAIARVAPLLSPDRAELAWRLGAGEPLERERLPDAVAAYRELLGCFEERHPARSRGVRASAARVIARAALHTPDESRVEVVRQALALDPALLSRSALARTRRRAARARARAEAARWIRELSGKAGRRPIRVAYVVPEPAPYRAAVIDRLAAHPALDLVVVYAAESVQWRTWRVEQRSPSVVLGGRRLPGAARVFYHDYPIGPGVFAVLRDLAPDVVVASGWSTFATQAAMLWARARRVPYVLQVESHDLGRRAGWRRAVKGTVVPWLVRGASGVLVSGTLARRSMLERGAHPDRMGLFAITIDVEEYSRRAELLRADRARIRRELGVGAEDVMVLSVARLSPEKGLDTVIRAAADAGDPRLVVVLVGAGPEEGRLRALARTLGVRLVLAGDRPWESVVEAYVAADVFALLSRREPWGVVVNEAAACGLPLVLADQVGAAFDLLRPGENGMLVPADDVAAATRAFAELANDPALRAAYGRRSRELVATWGYEPSVRAFVEAVERAVTGEGDTV
jgi:glycosyltransferase involved in cell wall biosynthesis